MPRTVENREPEGLSLSGHAQGEGYLNMVTTKFFIATPVAHDVVVSHYAASVFYVGQMMGRSGVEVDIQLLSMSDLEISRSVLASRFLAEPSYTHLLFIDSDTGFPATLVRRMIDFDEDFVSTMYVKRKLDLERVIRHARENPEENAHAVISRCMEYVGILTGESSTQGEQKIDIQSRGGVCHGGPHRHGSLPAEATSVGRDGRAWRRRHRRQAQHRVAVACALLWLFPQGIRNTEPLNQRGHFVLPALDQGLWRNNLGLRR